MAQGPSPVKVGTGSEPGVARGDTQLCGALLCQQCPVPSSPTLTQTLSSAEGGGAVPAQSPVGLALVSVRRWQPRARARGGFEEPEVPVAHRDAGWISTEVRSASASFPHFLRHHVRCAGPGEPGTARPRSASGAERRKNRGSEGPAHRDRPSGSACE